MERILWTKYEEAWLKQIWPLTNIPIGAIAYTLGRTAQALHHKAQRLGIRRYWYGSPEHMEQLRRIHESPEHRERFERMKGIWVGSPGHKKQLKHLHKTWVGSPKHKEHWKRVSKRGCEKLRAKPTWPEARFYGLVYGYDRLAKEFHAQELIPTTVCNHTVDGRWRDVIFELDGGGHNVYRDRTEHDRLVDAEYRAMGYRVVREETSSDLFLRLLQMSLCPDCNTVETCNGNCCLCCECHEAER
jgi:very-short-patch-repair endonuclease